MLKLWKLQNYLVLISVLRRSKRRKGRIAVSSNSVDGTSPLSPSPLMYNSSFEEWHESDRESD